MPRTARGPLTARKELTPQLRAQIIGAYRTGALMRNVAASLDVSFSNVQYTVKQESVRTDNASLPRRKQRKSDGPSDGFLVHHENLVASMPDRVEAVIRAQGGYTKY